MWRATAYPLQNDMTDRKIHNPQQCIAVLGSTGSIGTQTIDIILQYPDIFRAVAITARSNWRLLAEQARRLLPELVVIADERYLPPLQEALADLPVIVAGGEKEIETAATWPSAHTILTALVGYSGLRPTIAAIKAGKRIALANKETLVAGGPVIDKMLHDSHSRIIPVDSELSAIFQCLAGEKISEARRILLTASGGPFRTLSAKELEHVTVADALSHPNWDMGAKVTIDSASMMNKGFEMIEARWLFDCPPDRIEVVVHPQSIVHSMVEFHDGSIKAQLGMTDMHLPIRYALGWPDRLPDSEERAMPLSRIATLTFEQPDYAKFPLLRFAFEAIRAGGNMPAALNAANEVAVADFLAGRIRFTDMPAIAERTMQRIAVVEDPGLADIEATHTEATAIARDEAVSLTNHNFSLRR